MQHRAFCRRYSVPAKRKTSAGVLKNTIRTNRIGVTAFAVLLCCSGVAKTEEFTFHFDYPADAVIIAKVHREKIQMAADLKEPQKESEYSIRETRVQKVENGYRFAETCLEMTNTLNGKPWTNPLLPLLIGKTNVAIVSKDAALLSFSPGENIVEAAKQIGRAHV